jgi:hypothetical protein
LYQTGELNTKEPSMNLWHDAGWFAKLTLMIDLVPLAMAVIYVIRPTDHHLALMRPVSLAGLFSALTGTVIGTINVLDGRLRGLVWNGGSRRRGSARPDVCGVRRVDGGLAARGGGDGAERARRRERPTAVSGAPADWRRGADTRWLMQKQPDSPRLPVGRQASGRAQSLEPSAQSLSL